MEGLTKERAIALHRQLWNYIADETEKTQYCIGKYAAIDWMQNKGLIPLNYTPRYGCFACDYAIKTKLKLGDSEAEVNRCDACPLKWISFVSKYMCQYATMEEQDLKLSLCVSNGLYSLWSVAENKNHFRAASFLAREIANLPENSET